MGRGPSNSSRTTLGLVLIVLVVCAGFAWWSIHARWQSRYASLIPPLPDLTYEPAPVAVQLREAHQNALDDPTSAAAIGMLAKSLQASTFSRDAQKCFELAAQYEPDNWQWKYHLILLHEEFGESDAALAKLQELTRQRPDDALPWLKLAGAEFEKGNDDAAKFAYEKARSNADAKPVQSPHRTVLHPIQAHALLGLSRLSIKHEDYANAEQTLLSITQKYPKFGPAHRMLGRVYQEMNRAEEAQKSLAAAAECPLFAPPVDPLVDEIAAISRSHTYLLRTAAQARNEGDGNWSEHLLRRAYELYPDDIDVIGEYTLLLCVKQSFDAAFPMLQRYLSMQPEDPTTVGQIGTILSRHGQREPALYCMRYAAQRQPGQAIHHLNLGFALAVVGQFEDAERSLRRALELEPNSFKAQYNLAKVLYDAGQYGDSIPEAQKVLQEQPGDAQTRVRLAHALEETGACDSAIKEYRQFLEAVPNQPAALEGLALCLARTGDVTSARATVSQLKEVVGPHPRVYFVLAKIAVEAKEPENARQECRRALAIDPSFAPASELLAQLQ